MSDSAAGETHLYINGVLLEPGVEAFPLGWAKVMGARLEQATDHMAGFYHACLGHLQW